MLPAPALMIKPLRKILFSEQHAVRSAARLRVFAGARDDNRTARASTLPTASRGMAPRDCTASGYVEEDG
ncbi:hypothetical protein CIC12_18755 [Burkholderia sp. SG-MS1]|nr:hypothetical protein [Paraburkholderia sp. SG-MS1]